MNATDSLVESYANRRKKKSARKRQHNFECTDALGTAALGGKEKRERRKREKTNEKKRETR